MKIALVHELLTMRGGAERVFRAIAEMYPDAPIYTLLYNEKKLGDWFPKERIRPAKLSTRFGYNHHLYLKKFPAAVEAWDFSEFDIVISSSSAFVHGIITNGAPKHLCYVHSPARYLWDRTHDVQKRAGRGILGPIKKRQLSRIFHKLRIWDSEAADRPDKLLAASKEVQRRIELYWRRESDVITPFVDDFWLDNDFKEVEMETPDYFLVVSTLAPYKRIDIAIEACNKLNVPLKIVGEGPDEKRLKKLSGKSVEFYGYREGEELGDIMKNAKALIIPGEEDFGIVPLEAMAQGTPVIAYRRGGALETVIEGNTGAFFDEPNADSLLEVAKNFDQNIYSSDACQSRSLEFSRKRFETQISTAVEDLMNS